MGREKIAINMDSVKTRKDWKRFKLQDGANIYRILPPFGDAEVHKGYPYRKWSTAWLVDPATGKLRPFATPQTEGKECPIKDYSELLAKKIKEVEAKLIEKKLSKDQIKAKMEGLNKAQWQIRVNHTYAYNAANKQGEVGILEVKTTAHKGIKKLMMDYITEFNQDPTSLHSDIEDNAGVWFNITKSGALKDTEYNVAFNTVKENVNGKVYKVEDRSPLAEGIVESYDDMAYDLSAIYMRKSYDEMKEILLYNLALMAQQYPEVVLPGYDIDGIEVAAAPAPKAAVVEEDEDEEVAPAPVVKKKANVAIKLDDLDDEDDDVPAAPARKPVAPVAQAKPKAKSSFDAMAMADEILGED